MSLRKRLDKIYLENYALLHSSNLIIFCCCLLSHLMNYILRTMVRWGCHRSMDMDVVLSLGAPIRNGIGELDPQFLVYLKFHILQETRNEESEGKATSSIRWIVKRSHRVQNNLTNIELLAKEYGVNKSSRWSTNLSLIRKWVEVVCEEGSKQSYWLEKVSNQNIRWKRANSTI